MPKSLGITRRGVGSGWSTAEKMNQKQLAQKLCKRDKDGKNGRDQTMRGCVPVSDYFLIVLIK